MVIEAKISLHMEQLAQSKICMFLISRQSLHFSLLCKSFFPTSKFVLRQLFFFLIDHQKNNFWVLLHNQVNLNHSFWILKTFLCPNSRTVVFLIFFSLSSMNTFQILVRNRMILEFKLLQDVLDFDQFARNLTKEEQQQLLKYLPYADTTALPDRLLP